MTRWAMSSDDQAFSRSARIWRAWACVNVLLVLVSVASCSKASDSSSTSTKAASTPSSPPAAQTPPSPPPSPSKADTADEPLPPLTYEAELPESVREAMYQRNTDDLDALVKRRVIRVGVTYNRTHYFVDNGVQRGATYEFVKLFEDRLNTGLKTGNLRIHVVCIPLPRNQLLSALNEGRVDIVEGQLTITPERQAIVDFAPPTRTANEIVVTARGVPAVAAAEDLSGREVFVRKSSSYYESLVALNQRLEARGRPKVLILEAP